LAAGPDAEVEASVAQPKAPSVAMSTAMTEILFMGFLGSL